MTRVDQVGPHQLQVEEAIILACGMMDAIDDHMEATDGRTAIDLTMLKRINERLAKVNINADQGGKSQLQKLRRQAARSAGRGTTLRFQ